MKGKLILLCALLGVCTWLHAQKYTVTSPDGKIKVMVNSGKQLTWSIDYDGKQILNPSVLKMQIENYAELGSNVKVVKANNVHVDSKQTAVVPLKQKNIRDNYNQLTLNCKGDYKVVFRVYDNGAAYRFETNLNISPAIVINETVEQNWIDGTKAYWPREKSQNFITHCEAIFDEVNINSLSKDKKGYLPVYLSIPDGPKVVIMESDLSDYPNLFLTGDQNNTLTGEFPPVILKSKLREGADRDEVIVENAPYIASTEGKRTYPWRLVMINKDDKGVFENNLVYQLASPSVSDATDWIRPGKISWDWWSTLNVYGVDFKAGVNTDTYKYFIDFASKYGIEYILLDEGWSKSTWNIKESIAELDIPELVKYGKERNVGLVLWTLWNPLDLDLDAIFDLYQSWGIRGVKVDFMQRSDQYMVNFYERVGKAAMDRQLLVDFHGCFKPSGLQKKYPNVMTFEGVMGLEHDKDSRSINPVHDLILPFTRMVAGPMDYTPGAVTNATADDFCINFNHPMSLGTRAHQAALYIIYESSLQMLADSPSKYYSAPDFISFISQIPTTWEDTKAISAKIGEQLVVARRNGDTWYLAGMTNWDPRNIAVELDFLDDKPYNMNVFKDGMNADTYASDFKTEQVLVKKGDHIQLDMAPGGGWAAIISPAK